jgi:hypothetical protein
VRIINSLLGRDAIPETWKSNGRHIRSVDSRIGFNLTPGTGRCREARVSAIIIERESRSMTTSTSRRVSLLAGC